MSVIPPETGYSDDTRVLEALDFKSEIECERDDCSNSQSWLQHHSCCSSEWAVCEDHRQIVLKFLRDHPNGVRCLKCNYSWDPAKKIIIKWTKL